MLTCIVGRLGTAEAKCSHHQNSSFPSTRSLVVFPLSLKVYLLRTLYWKACYLLVVTCKFLAGKSHSSLWNQECDYIVLKCQIPSIVSWWDRFYSPVWWKRTRSSDRPSCCYIISQCRPTAGVGISSHTYEFIMSMSINLHIVLLHPLEGADAVSWEPSMMKIMDEHFVNDRYKVSTPV